jgi:hypothetical protein
MYREARAYNNSIYLMVGMPYLLLGILGCLVYRGVKQKALAEDAALTPPLPQSPESPSS